MAAAKSIIDMEKVEILEELLEMNVDPDEIHNIRDIYELSNKFLCNMLDNVHIDFDYLKYKVEFDDDELLGSSDRKIDIIQLVTKAIVIDVCAKDLCM